MASALSEINPFVLIVVIAIFSVLFLKAKSTKQRKSSKKTKEHRGFGEFEIIEREDETSTPHDIATNYQSQKTLLTKFEAAAFRQLVRALSGAAHVAPKVRIADILKVRASGNWKTDKIAFNRVAQKHVDFVVMSFSGEILFAVEIDDSTHQQPKRQKRDEFVNAAFASAGVELYRALPGKLSENTELVSRVRALRQPPEESIAEAG